MRRIYIFCVVVFLSCQLTLTAAAGSFIVSSTEVHQLFAHDHEVDHHHHDTFATHYDHGSEEPLHQHITDGVQHSALLGDCQAVFTTVVTVSKIAFTLNAPPVVFLDCLLRPPRELV